MIPVNPSPEALAKALYDAVTAACLYIQHEPTRDAVLQQIVDTQRKLNAPVYITASDLQETARDLDRVERRT